MRNVSVLPARRFPQMPTLVSMNTATGKKTFAWLTLTISAFFFGMGFAHPILQTGYGIGPLRLTEESIYLLSSFRYFFDKGEVFVGLLLLFFTIIFPVTKYIFLAFVLARAEMINRPLMRALEILNKWAMLDVFVVALLILNMKFDSLIIVSELRIGTTYFALSVIFLMIASFLTGRTPEKNQQPSE